MKTKYTGKLRIKDRTSPLVINFLDNFGGVKLNDITIMESAMEYLQKDDLDCIVGVKLTVYKNGNRLNAIKIVTGEVTIN